ncbi:MAG: MFS transporter, partial [Acetobacteraceae bacterium]|nr:MFS transporter [Acetobacteraceae bacterium]
AGMALGLYDAAFATAGTLLGPAVSPVITGVTLIAGFASTVGWPAGAELLRMLGWRGMLLAYAGVQLAVNLPLVLVMIPRGPLLQAHTGVSAEHSRSGRERRAAIACLAGFSQFGGS